MLNERRILVGVSGGVAAFKAVYLVRRLVEKGANVRVMMTGSAREFIGSQSFAAITGSHVYVELFGAESVSPHTELAQWADAVIIAPATANTLAKSAQGLPTIWFPPLSWQRQHQFSSPQPCIPRCGKTLQHNGISRRCAKTAATLWVRMPAPWPGATLGPGEWSNRMRSSWNSNGSWPAG